jgi:hypothetical protein
MIDERQCHVSNVCAESKAVRAVCRDVNLVQAARIGAKRCFIIAAKLTKVKGDQPIPQSLVFEVMRKRLSCCNGTPAYGLPNIDDLDYLWR